MKTLMDWFRSIFGGVMGQNTPGKNESTTTSKNLVSTLPLPLYPALDPDEYRKRLKQELGKKGHWPQGYEAIPDDPATMEVERRTYCNYFVKSVAAWFGFEKFNSVGSGRAADMTNYMMEHPAEWELVTHKVARDHACKGRLVIAGYIFPKPTSIDPKDWHASGHVAIIAPQKSMAFSAKWGKSVPKAANVGKRNWYGKGINWAFGKQEPQLFVFKGTSS